MAKTKTTETNTSVKDFIESYADSEQKKFDSYHLIELMSAWSGFEPKLWGTSIIGFGSYHYHYQSGHQGDAPLMGFSPRKAAFPCMSIHRSLSRKRCCSAWVNLKSAKPVST